MDRKLEDLLEGIALTTIACVVLLCDADVRAKVRTRVRMWRVYRREGTVPPDWVREVYDSTR